MKHDVRTGMNDLFYRSLSEHVGGIVKTASNKKSKKVKVATERLNKRASVSSLLNVVNDMNKFATRLDLDGFAKQAAAVDGLVSSVLLTMTNTSLQKEAAISSGSEIELEYKRNLRSSLDELGRALAEELSTKWDPEDFVLIKSPDQLSVMLRGDKSILVDAILKGVPKPAIPSSNIPLGGGRGFQEKHWRGIAGTVAEWLMRDDMLDVVVSRAMPYIQRKQEAQKAQMRGVGMPGTKPESKLMEPHLASAICNIGKALYKAGFDQQADSMFKLF